MTSRARAIPWAPVIVSALAIAGAHPFCNAMFHCGCSLFGLTAHCNIHSPGPLTGPTAPLSFGRGPAHCPWCAHPQWFALAFALAAVAAAIALWLVRRRSLGPSVLVGLAAAVAGGWLGALLTPRQ